jgi:hypothetical protein
MASRNVIQKCTKKYRRRTTASLEAPKRCFDFTLMIPAELVRSLQLFGQERQQALKFPKPKKQPVVLIET